jgi:hypothetical protein
MMGVALAAVCQRPFWDYLADGQLFKWLHCPYSIGGLGLTGVGFLVFLTGFVGLKNWSESWTLPLTWTAIVVPAMGAALLPGSVLRRLAGILTVAFAMLMIGLY